MKNPVKVLRTEVEDDGSNLKIAVIVENESDRTVHAYGSLRSFRYDQTRNQLTLNLCDPEPLTAGQTPIAGLPRFVMLDPKKEGRIEFQMPRSYSTLSGTLKQNGAPEFVSLAVHQANQITVEVACSDTPFYRDPRSEASTEAIRAQLVKWGRWRAKGTWQRPKKKN